jgi:hypothetical protein
MKILTRNDWTEKGLDEVYISVDIECDGPSPGTHSMISLGAAAYDRRTYELIDVFTVNLKPLRVGFQDKSTMEFWDKWPAAYKIATTDPVTPREALQAFNDWAKRWPNKVLAAYPAGFDFSFIYWYYTHLQVTFPEFENPWGFSALDLKTVIMCLLNVPYKQAVKSRCPSKWFTYVNRNPHVALDDALEQGAMMCNMLKELDQNAFYLKPVR